MKCGKKCTKFMELDHMLKCRKEFWGDLKSKPPNAKTRRQRIAKELRKARDQYQARVERIGKAEGDKVSNNLLFQIDGEEVCEKAFINVLGLADRNGQKSKMWNHEIAKFFGT